MDNAWQCMQNGTYGAHLTLAPGFPPHARALKAALLRAAALPNPPLSHTLRMTVEPQALPRARRAQHNILKQKRPPVEPCPS